MPRVRRQTFAKKSTRPGHFGPAVSCLILAVKKYRFRNSSGTLELPVIVDDVSVALAVVPEGCLSPAAVFLLATGLEGITANADVLAALGIRTTRPAVVSTICILATISILATACILAT